MIGIGEVPYYSKALKYGYAVNFPDRNKTIQVYFENQQKRFLLDYDCDPRGKITRIRFRR
jgi:hypothetical protein